MMTVPKLTGWSFTSVYEQVSGREAPLIEPLLSELLYDFIIIYDLSKYHGKIQ